MQCLCVPLKDDKKKCEPAGGPSSCAEECEHSFCVTQRMKKQSGCVDLPPKGLPWASGLLRYLPGQRDLYKDLYLKDQVDQEATKAVKQAEPPCRKKPSKSTNKQRTCEEELKCLCYCGTNGKDGNGKKGRNQGKKSKRSSRKSAGSDKFSDTSSQNDGGGGGKCKPCCIELEQVLVCDGCSPQPRQAWIVKPCKRPEIDECVELAVNQDQGQSNGGVEGMVCLVVPRAYLQQNRAEEVDLCAKYGVKLDDPCPAKEPTVPEVQAEDEIKSTTTSKKEEPPSEAE